MQKQFFRQSQKKRLKQHILFKFKQDFQVFKECFILIKKFKAKKILIFTPLPHEPNLLRFRNKLNKNKQIFVPFMQNKSLKIVKLRLPLTRKKFGIFEPNNSFLKTKIDMAIVPVIGVDRIFKRIGHGQGFYDRFFESLKYKPLIIFIESIDSFSEKILTQKHDITGKFYINPYKKYFRKESKNDSSRCCSYRRYNRHWSRIFSC